MLELHGSSSDLFSMWNLRRAPSEGGGGTPSSGVSSPKAWLAKGLTQRPPLL